MKPSIRLIAIMAAALLLPIEAYCDGSFVGPLTVSAVGSTIPANGDLNPYGVAPVLNTNGNLVAGNILISNFNASSNQQGTGTTPVQITPTGTTTLFAHISDSACTGGVGLTTAGDCSEEVRGCREPANYRWHFGHSGGRMPHHARRHGRRR